MRLAGFRLAAVLTLLATCVFAFAQLPPTLTFAGASGATAKLINITYDPGTVPTGALSGKGDLVFDMGGGNTFTNAGQVFAGIFADSSGNVNTGKAGYTFKKDIPWTNMMGSGLTATIKAPITIVVEVSGSGHKATLTAAAQCQLPFRDDSGNPATFSANSAKLIFDGGANSVKFDTDLVAAGAPKVQAAGFGIGLDSPHLTVQTPAKPLLTMSSATIKVSTPIPSVFTDGNVTLVAKNFSIDETGLPNFDSLTLGSDTAAVEATPLSEEELANRRVSLVQPVNFGLELTGVSGSVQKGKIHDLHISANLVFPDAIKNEDRPTDPAMVPITYDLADPKFKRSGSGDVKLLWQPVSSGPTFHLAIHSFTLDMARGLTDLTADLRIQNDDRLASASGVKDITLGAKGMSIDGNGISGTVSVTTPIKVFGLTVSKGSMTFDRDTVVGGAFTGNLSVPTLGSLGFGIGISQNGSNVMLQASQGLSWPGIGKMNVTKGGGSIDKNNKVTFNLTGDVSIDALSGVDLAFEDLQIDSDGHISADELALAKPVSIPLFGLTLVANKIVYKVSPTSIRIDGDIKFPDSLPVSGDVGFDGLTIHPGSSKLEVGRIHFSASIQGVGQISGAFEGNGNHPDQGFKNTLEGAVSANLDCLAGAGLGCKILIADGGTWLVGGDVTLPVPITLPIPPPPTGPLLDIYGFKLALGHNVVRRPGIIPDPADPFKEYAYNGSGGLLIEGGVKFETIDETTAWGPVTLTVVTNPFQLMLTGQFGLLTPRLLVNEKIDPNRSANITLGYFDGGFELHGDLVFKLPLFEITGGVDAKFNDKQGYIYVGWPVKDRGITTTVGLKGVVAASSKEGIGLDLYPKPMLQAGLEESVDLLIVHGRRWINFGFSPGLKDTHVHLDVGVEGKVDFLIATLSASAEASDDFDIGTGGFHNTLRGRFEAKLETFLGDISVHAEGEVLSW